MGRQITESINIRVSDFKIILSDEQNTDLQNEMLSELFTQEEIMKFDNRRDMSIPLSGIVLAEKEINDEFRKFSTYEPPNTSLVSRKVRQKIWAGHFSKSIGELAREFNLTCSMVRAIKAENLERHEKRLRKTARKADRRSLDYCTDPSVINQLRYDAEVAFRAAGITHDPESGRPILSEPPTEKELDELREWHGCEFKSLFGPGYSTNNRLNAGLFMNQNKHSNG